MRSYTRLTWIDRTVIEKLYNSGASERVIASRLGRSPSCIHYELKRGLYDHLDGSTYLTVKRYSATIAQDDADYQATSKGGPLKLGNNYSYAREISTRVKQGESPDSIVGSKRLHGEWTVSTNTLYRYIDKHYIPDLSNKDLIVKSQKKHHKSHVHRAKRAPKGPSIENRPAAISERLLPGDWEQDTVIGKSSGRGEALLVLTERVTRAQIIEKLIDKTMSEVTRHLTSIVSRYPKGTFRTITVDNGSENQDYEGMKKLVGEIYYCHPYSSWERGSNENQNRLIRRFFPKHESMQNKTQADADKAAAFINNMPRKILGYHTSQELFDVWQDSLRAAENQELP